jgi:tetratricopeptide (TPR) repeat protein
MTDAERHQAQVLYGEILEDVGSYAEALAQLKAVTTLDDTSGDAWVSRFLAEAGLNNDADALSSLTTIANRWPSSLSGITDQYLFSFISRTNHKPEFKRAHTELLEAMHAAHWVPTSPLNSPDGLWLQLALALLEDGQTELAAAAVSGVQSPSVLKTMLIDRRFDPVTSAEPQVIDISKAAVVTLASQQAAAAAEPNSLRGVNTVASTLVALNRPAEALAVVEQALKQVRLAEGGKSPFEDMDQINWAYDVRARALFVLGRYDEAIAQMKAGATNQEDGNPNVSQTLNLAIVLIHLGRPADALALVGGLSQDHTTGYGRMVLEGVRAEAYSALHDQTRANASVAYLKAHVDDGPQNFIDALLDTGDMDGAAVETIKLLNNPLQRDTALESLQDYIIPAGVPPFLRHHHDLVVALRQRPDVKAAIDAVGRIELIPLVDDEL